MRWYGQRASNPKGTPEDSTRCLAEVWSGPRGMTSAQCGRKRGHGYEGWLCKQHAHAVANDGRVTIPPDDADGAAPDDLRMPDDAPEPAWIAAQASANAAARDGNGGGIDSDEFAARGDYESDAPYLTDDAGAVPVQADADAVAEFERGVEQRVAYLRKAAADRQAANQAAFERHAAAYATPHAYDERRQAVIVPTNTNGQSARVVFVLPSGAEIQAFVLDGVLAVRGSNQLAIRPSAGNAFSVAEVAR